MNNFTITLKAIEECPIFEKLFKNDVVVYGKFVREILVEGYTLDEFSKNRNRTIHCYAKLIYKDIIERDLYSYIVDSIEYDTKNISNNVTVTYSIKIGNCSFLLEILYVRTIIEFTPKLFENELQCIIDIDALSIDRTGVKCMELFNNTPYLFSEILNNINLKRFNFKPTIIRLSVSERSYVENLLTLGYININSKIEKVDTDAIKECTICYESDNKEFVKLKCGHCYHKECLQESIELFYSNPKKIYYKCPYCSYEYTETDLIMSK